MRKIVLMVALAASMAVAACNTLAGAGRDVESAGEAVTNTAEDAKR
jgi:entericidin B